MGQDARRKKDEDATGRDLPNADGMVSDEDVNAIDNKGGGKTGQDHSLDDHELAAPAEGVGSVQDSSDRTSGTAKISD